jgi:membrane protease subunit (stomatin/prohibitin family)
MEKKAEQKVSSAEEQPLVVQEKFIEPEVKVLKNDVNGNFCCPSFLSCLSSSLCACTWFGSCMVVNERTEHVLLNWGQYFAVLREPGLYCINPAGITTKVISTSRCALDLTQVKVADQKGNPLMVSGVVTYQIVDSRKAALDVPDTKGYISTQGLAVMKKICSMYPYEAKKGEHSLKSEASLLRKEMIALLQERVAPAGVLIINFELTDLSYAAEIAQQMLIRQQAEAMIDARKIIVEGAVSIAHGAIVGLEERGLKMTKEEEGKMVSKLLVVICGDSKVTNNPAAHAAPTAPHPHPHNNNNTFIGSYD